MEESPRDVDAVRSEIDDLDANLVEMLNRRASLAQEIGLLKGRDGKPFFTPERERAIFERLAKLNQGPLLAGQLQGIFREVISAARAAETPLVAACWGPAGTFSHAAALQAFGRSAELRFEESITDVFLSVEHRKAHYGVVPIENSIAGIVPETLDGFPLTNVKICAEVYLPVHHHLVTTCASLESIERVYAGPQPAAQCRHWLRENLRHATVVQATPTSRAAQLALEDPAGAAVANRMGAELVGIPILREHIEDNPHNRTRFLVVGFNEPNKTGADKTSLMFNLRNKPGELHRALGALVAQEVNLQMIESRPAPRASFEYLFFCDCEGHRVDPHLERAIEALKGCALETIVLGSYPAADPLAPPGSPG